jgi:signal transduction histidine kinase
LISVDSCGGGVRFEVRDEGLGVPAGERERVFEKYYRLDRDRGVGGTGLGLYVSRQLVVGMGGRIWVEPRPAGGSAFVVELPAEGSPASAEPPAASTSAAPA